MKSKEFKYSFLGIIILSVLVILILYFTTNFYLKKYNQNNNILVATIVDTIKEKNKDITEEEIVSLLNTKQLKNTNTLEKYGIDIQNDSISIANEELLIEARRTNLVIIVLFVILVTILIFYYYNRKDVKIKKITSYLKEINKQNYQLDIDMNSEDELSLLKNELYKTAIKLNEQAIHSKEEKKALKTSLEDISHQLRTPLTSISLMIDNLIENPNLSKEKKKELLNSINRKIKNINFLVESLLKLSKFDSNTIIFKREKVVIKDLINEIIDNVGAICDLKDITINVNGNNEDYLFCDYKWELEALTNIVKNCTEHSNPSSNIDIRYETNAIFTKITIKDYGIGIAKKDLNHIFERFYKGSNSNQDSFGIGLALAKTIIEKDNGYITLDSTPNKGTTFIIKYLK